MLIYVQKLSNPSEEFSLDVESSDTIAGIKSKVQNDELPTIYDPSRINLFFNGTELLDGQVLSFYGIVKNSNLTSSYTTPPPPPRRTVVYMS